MSPHVDVRPDRAGIPSLLEYRLDTAQPIRELTQVLLRGPSTLFEAERELIATIVSHRNARRFGATAHTAAAELLMGESDTVDAVKRDPATAPVSAKLRALRRIAAHVQEHGRQVSEADVAAARAEGATDVEIHDTVLIAALLCLYSRYVDRLASFTPDDPAYYRTLADRIVHRGYTRPPGGPPALPAAR